MEIRSESLNRSKYGGYSDWEILYAISCVNAGELETKIKKELAKYSLSNFYKHDGKNQNTDEIYRCSYSKSKEKLQDLIINEKFNADIKVEKIGSNYQFPNLARK